MPAYFDMGFSVRLPAWHGLATVLAEYPGREEAMKIAGHDWRVKERSVAVRGEGDTEPEYNTFTGWKALVRSDTGKVISVVKSSYTPIQHSVLWDIVDAMVQQPNVKYETAGVLRNGCTLWVLARLDEPWFAPGDKSAAYPYVMATTAHDGTHSTSASAIGVRVVCWNTWQMAIRDARRSGLYYSFKHTANVQQRMDEAREALRGVRDQFAEYKEMVEELSRHGVTEDGVEKFVKKFIPSPARLPRSRRRSRAEQWVNRAPDNFYHILYSQTVSEQMRYTSYGLWCAGTEFLDHYRAFKTKETYFSRCVTPSSLKYDLAKLALEVAK